MKVHGGCGCKGARTYVYTATALGKGRVASPTLGRLYPRYSFYSRLSGPPEAVWVLRTEENLHPYDTRNRTRAIDPVAKHIAA